MGRSLAAIGVLALATAELLLPGSSRAVAEGRAMRFTLRQEGPARTCGMHCRLLVAARGAITAETPRDFANFAVSHNLTGALVVLNSGGGSVHGAIKLGREIRKLGLDTTVGRLIDIDSTNPGRPRAKLSPRANCESMCAFVLLAGVHRTVPPEARVLVHQIWLGDRRADPTAANYSAEDLALVQRDIGKLARYTVDMGASIELLNLALRIPPWERMYRITRAEIRDARVATETARVPATATVAASPRTADKPPMAQLTGGLGPSAISERHWGIVVTDDIAVLARRQPLTVEGEEIGSFDLMVSCGSSNAYDVSYVEQRHGTDNRPLPTTLRAVSMSVSNATVPLKVVTSERRRRPDELVTFATAMVPVSLIDDFAGAGNHSLIVETESPRLTTGIRLGNTGARDSLPMLAGTCRKTIGEPASVSLQKGGQLTAAK